MSSLSTLSPQAQYDMQAPDYRMGRTPRVLIDLEVRCHCGCEFEIKEDEYDAACPDCGKVQDRDNAQML